jgi:enoyl-CoA hydratase/carnithine racemase
VLDLEMGQELLNAALRCDEDPEIRALVLSGAGRTFCVGDDVKDFAEQGEGLPSYLKELTAHFHAAISRRARMDPPVAAVHGVAAGGGFSLAISCDLVFAAESARFAMAYSNISLGVPFKCVQATFRAYLGTKRRAGGDNPGPPWGSLEGVFGAVSRPLSSPEARPG